MTVEFPTGERDLAELAKSPRLEICDDCIENLKFAGDKIYSDSVQAFTRRCVEKPVHSWDRLRAFAKGPLDSEFPEYRSHAKVQPFVDEFLGNIPYDPNAEQRNMSRMLVALGLGVGTPVRRLYERLPCQHLTVLIEHLDEVIATALHEDFALWEEVTKRRKGSIQFIYYPSVDKSVQELMSRIESQHAFTFDGMILAAGTERPFANRCLRAIHAWGIRAAGNPGFFDDEVKMVDNVLENLNRNPGRLYTGQTHSGIIPGGAVSQSTQVPAFIIGSGPSLTNSLPIIKQFADRAILFSCGTALLPLLKAGITPDFQIELENLGDTEKAYFELEEQDLNFRLPIGLSSLTVIPDIMRRFDRRLYFCRQHQVVASLLGNVAETLPFSDPTVTNAGLTICLKAGMNPIYFFGVDLGSRNPKNMHAKGTIYDEKTGQLPSVRPAERVNIDLPGNFNGTILSHDRYVSCRSHLSLAIQLHGTSSVINCSDGARVDGTQALRPERVRITPTPEDKRLALRNFLRISIDTKNLLGQGMLTKEAFAQVESLTKHQFARARDLLTQVRSMKKTFDAADLYFKMFGELTGVPPEKLATNFLRGSLYSMLAIHHSHHRRIPHAKRKPFQRAYYDHCLGLLDQMEASLSERFETWNDSLPTATQPPKQNRMGRTVNN